MITSESIDGACYDTQNQDEVCPLSSLIILSIQHSQSGYLYIFGQYEETREHIEDPFSHRENMQEHRGSNSSSGSNQGPRAA